MQKRKLAVLLAALVILIVFRQLQPEQIELHQLNGTTMGVISYSILYLAPDEENYQKEVDDILVAFNQSLSTYIPNSEISLLNKGDTISYQSAYLLPILEVSKEIYEKSGGAYDPTIGPLVNAWGFGPEKKTRLDSALVDSLLRIVNFNLVHFDSVGVTKPKGVSLDFSASAKGYALDVVAEFLEGQSIENYMIEIGGEVRCKGRNQQETIWKIGIEKPSMSMQRGDLFATVFLKNQSLATSGNYRNYYEIDGKIISHTISPFTGYSVSHTLLSASVFAPNCALADGYATACMVLGLDASIQMIEQIEGVEALLIYSSEDGALATYISKGIESQMEVL
jgi:thiamine biosynthesis lipoprotein